MTGKRVLEPWEVRSAFRDPFIRRRLAALPPEQRATAFAEWEAEQAAKRKGKPIQAERLYTLADLEEAERWARETPGSGNNPNKHRGRIKMARLMEGIIRAQLIKRGIING
jgi:hypothetical protein